jgi:hypothetical protein
MGSAIDLERCGAVRCTSERCLVLLFLVFLVLIIYTSDDNGPSRAGFVSNSGSDLSFKTLGPVFASEYKIFGPTRP